MLRGCLYSACIRSAVAIYAVATHWYVHVSCTCLVFFSVLYASTKRLQLNMYVFMCLKKQLFFCVCVYVSHGGMWSFDPSMNSSLTFTRPLCCCLCLFLCVCVCVHIPWRAHTWKHTYALGSISLDGWIAEIEKKNHASCCRAQQVFRNVGCSLITMFFSFFSFLAVVNYFPNYNHYANEKLELKLSLCWCLIVSRQEQW